MGRYKVYVTDTESGKIDEYEGNGVFVNVTSEDGSNGHLCCDGLNGIEMGAWMRSIDEQQSELYDKHPDILLAVKLANLLNDIEEED